MMNLVKAMHSMGFDVSSKFEPALMTWERKKGELKKWVLIYMEIISYCDQSENQSEMQVRDKVSCEVNLRLSSC